MPSDGLPSASAAFSMPKPGARGRASGRCGRHAVRPVGACDSWRAAYRRWSASRGASGITSRFRRARGWWSRAWRDIKAALAEQSMDAIVASCDRRRPRRPAEGRRAEPALRVRDPRPAGPGVRRRGAGGTAPPCATPSTASPRPLRRRLRLRLREYCTRFVSITEAMALAARRREATDVHFAANYDGSWRFVAGVDVVEGLPTVEVETVFANDGRGSRRRPHLTRLRAVVRHVRRARPPARLPRGAAHARRA